MVPTKWWLKPNSEQRNNASTSSTWMHPCAPRLSCQYSYLHFYFLYLFLYISVFVSVCVFVSVFVSSYTWMHSCGPRLSCQYLYLSWYFTSVNVTVLISIFSFNLFLYQETMPEWPPLILDQENNLLVSFLTQNMVWMVLNNFSKWYWFVQQQKRLLPCATFYKVANETSDVRRLALPVGQAAKLYCPKKSFENYPGWQEWT